MKSSLNSLYHIREDHLRIVSEIEEADGEVTEDLIKALEVKERELTDCAVSFASIVQSFEDTEDAIDKEIKRLKALQAKAQKGQEFFKKMITESMNQFRVESINTPTMRLFFRAADSVLIEDERLIPDEFKKTPAPVVSKELVKEGLKAGKTIPGACMITKRHLQIR